MVKAPQICIFSFSEVEQSYQVDAMLEHLEYEQDLMCVTFQFQPVGENRQIVLHHDNNTWSEMRQMLDWYVANAEGPVLVVLHFGESLILEEEKLTDITFTPDFDSDDDNWPDEEGDYDDENAKSS